MDVSENGCAAKEYKELKRALYILASEIRYSASLSDAAEMVNKQLRGAGASLCRFVEDMNRKRRGKSGRALERGVRKRQRELNLDEEDCMMLCSWASIWLDKTLSFAKSDPLA